MPHRLASVRERWRGAAPAALTIWVALLLMAVLPATAAAQGAEAGEADADAATAAQAAGGELPFVTIDREAGHVDLEAQVVEQPVEWLELIASSPESREHESIVTVRARPSHVHLALLMLGLEPGGPYRAERRGPNDFAITQPHGPEVEVFFVLEGDEGDEDDPQEVPANEWVVHRETGETMRGNTWLFAGSRIFEVQDRRVYLADQNGTVVSLVNFGDDLLARPTEVTHETDEQMWVVAEDRLPPWGTKLTLRLRPRRPSEADAGDEADTEPEEAGAGDEPAAPTAAPER